ASQQLLRIRPVGLRAENEGVDTIMQAEIAPLDDFIPHGNTGTDVHLSLNFDMRDNVPLKVIMNAKTSDNIVVYGNGTLHATWYNKGTFQLFGTYNVERGEYKLRIQDVIHKNLQFSSGGKVYFNGRPFDGQLNLQASYPINSVSLSDLNFPSSIGSNTVKVNCLLNMSGTVSAPEVKFDLELPSAGEEVKQAVRRLVSTEEEMNQQIVYLLGVGRFYRYQSDYVSAQNNATPSGEAAAVNSFLSSTLSGQLNEFISDAVKSNNWRLGTNLSTGDYGWRDLEVEAMLSGRLLNDRLLINGNFGYRDRVEQPQNAGFVGDFDIQYLLTPNGTLRLKAYSQTNDRYFTKSTLTTQGIGVTVQRDFNKIRQLFTRTRRNKSKTNSEK
ncbi:MAG: translocation/assembly module TamB domain-containing protein, partial [Bacteroidaceae bacterium]|nr:translocation/assembly module TamB domain-containing protein [Bacteroidaceae bacterium]